MAVVAKGGYSALRDSSGSEEPQENKFRQLNKDNMAGVAKWLRPRIVVPIRVGSNPTTRPSIKTLSMRGFYIILKYLIMNNSKI